ncbi:hypothetical protein KP509_19G018000 [Ceratopteris richardii]|uniref:RING-type domain-containing protein n=1 Tax=Ceratopteris richardii TaxID=49495 RepID=A0A8T2SME2_CERRI|nr:hypothetical protein KP509_19G018000 [Ceratopteris richardii]
MVPILLVVILDRGTEVHTEEDDSDESTSVSVVVDPPLGVKQQDLCRQLESLPELAFEDACNQSRFVDKGAECQICLEAFTETDHIALLTPCNHGFHPTCLKNWILLETSCPICRGKPQLQTSSHGTSSHNFILMRLCAHVYEHSVFT